jgi:hypothetical protein
VSAIIPISSNELARLIGASRTHAPLFATTLLVLTGLYGTNDAARAEQTGCKVCTDQQRACMKNYAGPTCKSEYQICMKSCGKKS